MSRQAEGTIIIVLSLTDVCVSRAHARERGGKKEISTDKSQATYG